MQSNMQFLNLCLDANTLGQFQFPILYTTSVISGNINLQNFQNFGTTSLTNASKNSIAERSNEVQTNKIQKQSQVRRPGIEKKTNWTFEEDQQLKNLVEEQKLEWTEIVRRIPNRTYKMCYSRYQRIKEEKKVNWSEEEQNKIRELVSLFGKRWKHISQMIPNRSPKQIRERYLNYLRPNISHDKWTEDQDLQLLDLIKKHGHKWKTIERFMCKRSQNQLKNRFYGRLKKIVKNGTSQEINLQNSS